MLIINTPSTVTLDRKHNMFIINGLQVIRYAVPQVRARSLSANLGVLAQKKKVNARFSSPRLAYKKTYANLGHRATDYNSY